MAFLERVTNKFVDNWKEAYKWMSVQLALIAGVIAAYMAANPDDFQKLMDMLPQHIRPFVGLFVALVPIYLRLRKQTSPAAGNE